MTHRGTRRRQWLTTSYRTAETNGCSGTRVTGSRSASDTTTARPVVRTAVRPTPTEGGRRWSRLPQGDFQSLRATRRRPAPPLALKNAELIGRGSRGTETASQNVIVGDVGLRKSVRKQAKSAVFPPKPKAVNKELILRSKKVDDFALHKRKTEKPGYYIDASTEENKIDCSEKT